MKTVFRLIAAALVLPQAGFADPSMECSVNVGSQGEIRACVAEAEAAVDQTIESSLGFAMEAAGELDEITGRAVAVPTLEAGQAAWSAYRDAHCGFVGATFGGGSGTGIAIQSCRVELGCARVSELMAFTQ